MRFGTDIALVTLVHELYQELDWGNATLLVLLDFPAAFNLFRSTFLKKQCFIIIFVIIYNHNILKKNYLQMKFRSEVRFLGPHLINLLAVLKCNIRFCSCIDFMYIIYFIYVSHFELCMQSCQPGDLGRRGRACSGEDLGKGGTSAKYTVIVHIKSRNFLRGN